MKNIKDVVDWRLCVGCGACEYICPQKNITMNDFEHVGIRPVIAEERCMECHDCLNVCPGYECSVDWNDASASVTKAMKKGWGPVLEIYEGFAVDNEIRYLGSSGGCTTAIALYCLQKKNMEGVLHIKERADIPWKNETVLSRTREQLLTATGSRYAPASPCNGLGNLEKATGPCVFIGKPCDIAGMRNASKMRKQLKENMGLAISIFCAGTPSTKATTDWMEKGGITADPTVSEVRYRGKGWPGQSYVKLKGEDTPMFSEPYMKCWSFCQEHRPFRCYLCPDHTGETADISCGDPWYMENRQHELGFSVIFVRTERGKEIIRGALDEGFLSLKAIKPSFIIKTKHGLPSKRGENWGRYLTLKCMRIPTPRYRGYHLFANWLDLDIKKKIRSIIGTLKRIITRSYNRRTNLWS